MRGGATLVVMVAIFSVLCSVSSGSVWGDASLVRLISGTRSNPNVLDSAPERLEFLLLIFFLCSRIDLSGVPAWPVLPVYSHDASTPESFVR